MVSIIMPAYNAERYIEEAIQSVFFQTSKDWELIVVDDCSTDNTPYIIEALSKTHGRIRYLKNKNNLGVSESRNRGVSLALGEWVAFLDSDDCWHPEKLQLQLDFAYDNHADFIFTGSAFMKEDGDPLDYYLPVPSTINYCSLLKQNVISCSSVLIRKKLMLQYPMRNGISMHEDFAVWLQILHDEQIFAYGINMPLLRYRISSSSKSGNKIKAGIMTYRVYRHLGIHWIPALFYWFHYCVRSIVKYRYLIKKSDL